MSTIFHLPINIRSEFDVDDDGKTYASQSATSRLCGVSQSAINQLLEKLAISKPISKPLLPFAGIDYRAISKLPDLLVIAIPRGSAEGSALIIMPFMPGRPLNKLKTFVYVLKE